MSEFNDKSVTITNLLSKEEKKNDGIFFTPFTIINKTINTLPKINYNTILEPSCGSCQFIDIINELFIKTLKNYNITGIEYNKKIYENIKDIYTTNDNISLLNENFLTHKFNTKYNLIIGNPPYYVIKQNNIPKDNIKYKNYFSGRPNIFVLFIIKCMSLLDINGVLAFVLPKNFLNCLYYNKLRKEIYTKYKIIAIEECYSDNYIDTEQDTIIFTIQKIELFNDEIVSNNKQYTYIIGENIVFNTTENITILTTKFTNYKTLKELDFEAKIGSIVWNQVKNKLTDDNTKTKLIYNSNVKNGELIDFDFKNDSKKQYINHIDKKIPNTEPCIVINRGYGKGEYKFNYCLIDVDYPYLVENHLIQIKCVNNDFSTDEKMEQYKKLILALQDERLKEFIALYFTNNAINITELNEVLPIWM